jgi:phosphatidylinositol dimannoside acyltransferase
VHPPVAVPGQGDRAHRTAVMTQALADAYASGIAAHPEDWHMLQRLWLADLDPRPVVRPGPDGGAGPVKATGSESATGSGSATGAGSAPGPDSGSESGPGREPGSGQADSHPGTERS